MNLYVILFYLYIVHRVRCCFQFTMYYFYFDPDAAGAVANASSFAFFDHPSGA